MGVGLIQSAEGLKSKDWDTPLKKKFWLQRFCLSFQPSDSPVNSIVATIILIWITSLPTSPLGFGLVTLHSQVSQFLKINLNFSLFLYLDDTSIYQFSSVHSVMSDSATPWIAARQASLSITNSQRLLKLMPIESVMPSSHLILCCPLLLLPPIPPSIRVISNESTLRMRWPKYWSFSFSISPSNEHPGLISFTMDWLDLLAVQGTLKSLLQHHSSKASILLCSAFFTVQFSHPNMTTGKTIALTRQTFVGKVMSLLFNILSRLYIYIHIAHIYIYIYIYIWYLYA